MLSMRIRPRRLRIMWLAVFSWVVSKGIWHGLFWLFPNRSRLVPMNFCSNLHIYKYVLSTTTAYTSNKTDTHTYSWYGYNPMSSRWNSCTFHIWLNLDSTSCNLFRSCHTILHVFRCNSLNRIRLSMWDIVVLVGLYLSLLCLSNVIWGIVFLAMCRDLIHRI